ncbi:MAG: type II toxin-antitoxin system HicA family toxin [candidate division KSB1 bacterium]|nr:type II toxin-antitoxin system HicA family toxin [candidate division KSB1 bacterium]
MTKLAPVKNREFIKKLKKAGFDGPYAGGKHLYMIRGDLGLTIPNPHKNEIGVALLRRILQQADILPEEWNQL